MILAGEGREAHPITNWDQAAIHRVTRSVIEAAVAEPDPRHFVVVTHHALHPSCLPAADCSATWRLAGCLPGRCS